MESLIRGELVTDKLGDGIASGAGPSMGLGRGAGGGRSATEAYKECYPPKAKDAQAYLATAQQDGAALIDKCVKVGYDGGR